MHLHAFSLHSPPLRCCAVCGTTDARTLSNTSLASGAVVTVCGSHAVAHARAPQPARSLSELRSMLGERRSTRDRRDGHGDEADELAHNLTAAFAGERRGPSRRTA